MNKTIAIISSFLILMSSCSQDDVINDKEDPGNVTNNGSELVYTDVEPLEKMSYWTPSEAEQQNLKEINDFAFNFHRNIIDNSSSLWEQFDGNYSVSPVSISIFLSALSQSVDGQAREDICRLIGINENEVVELNNKLIRYLSRDIDYLKSSISNSIWHDPSMPILDSYKEFMASNFGAPVNCLDMYSESAKDIINQWASDKTFGIIDDLLKEAPNAQFFIANALYFSGAWIEPFDSSRTQDGTFFGQNGENAVKMMNSFGDEAYANVDGTQYIYLPIDNATVVDFILPAENCDFDDFGKKIDSQYLSLLQKNLTTKKVDLYLPKFSSRSDADITSLLKSMGYPSYDMSTLEMTGSNNNPLLSNYTKIKHITEVNVNEKGIELAAITSGEWALSNGTETEYETMELKFNRPFYYIVRNTTTNSIILIGRISNL